MALVVSGKILKNYMTGGRMIQGGEFASAVRGGLTQMRGWPGTCVGQHI
jgi:hypothetical protein